MRLYPPAYVIYRRSRPSASGLDPEAVHREAVGDDSVAGFRVPEEAVVGMPQWVVHRDPRWYDDPEAFYPDRWDGERADRPTYAYFPFGGSPRQCIGEAFAMREATLVLATLGRRYALDYAGDGLDLVSVVTLHPEPPVEFNLRAR